MIDYTDTQLPDGELAEHFRQLAHDAEIERLKEQQRQIDMRKFKFVGGFV